MIKGEFEAHTHAYASVPFEIPDEKVKEWAESEEMTVDELLANVEMLKDFINENVWSYVEMPTLGANASGWGQKWSLNLNDDEWEIEDPENDITIESTNE